MPKLTRNIQYQPRPDISSLPGMNTDGIVDGQGLLWDGINEEFIPADLVTPADLYPETLTFTYNGDGTVAGINGATTDLDFTYNGDKTVNTIDDQTFIKTFSYNPDKTVSDISISAS